MTGRDAPLPGVARREGGAGTVGSVSRALRDYLWATYAGAVALVVAAGLALVAGDPLTLAHRALWPGVALFATLAFLAEWQVLPVTALLWWSLDSALYVAALLTFPWPLPLLVALPAMLVMRGWRWRARLPRRTWAFNVAHGLLTVGLADALGTRVTALTTLTRPGHLDGALPALVLLGALYYALDVAPLLVVHALSAGRAPWRLWGEQHRPLVPLALADFALGVLAALTWRDDPVALGLLTLPLVVVALALRARARARAAEGRAASALALAATDGLTDLPNRRAFQARLDDEVARTGRAGGSLALIMVDLDDFGAINNAHGHQVGDAALVAVAAALRASVREADVPTRYGGDEFVVILPATTLDEAMGVAARARAAIAAVRVATDQTTVGVGASLGVAALPQQARTGEALVGAADRAAYAAKDAGKGRVGRSGTS